MYVRKMFATCYPQVNCDKITINFLFSSFFCYFFFFSFVDNSRNAHRRHTKCVMSPPTKGGLGGVVTAGDA